jgi:hypothetical protein
MAALSVVVSGIIGFFTAIRTIDAELSSLRQEIVAFKTENKNNSKDVDRLRAQLNQVSSLELRVTRIEVVSGIAIKQYEWIIERQLRVFHFPRGELEADVMGK